MDKLSGERIYHVNTSEVLKNIEIEIKECEIDENDESVEVADRIKGVELKEYLANMPKEKGQYMSPEQIGKELSERGVKDEQYYKRLRIVNALTAYLEKL